MDGHGLCLRLLPQASFPRTEFTTASPVSASGFGSVTLMSPSSTYCLKIVSGSTMPSYRTHSPSCLAPFTPMKAGVFLGSAASAFSSSGLLHPACLEVGPNLKREVMSWIVNRVPCPYLRTLPRSAAHLHHFFVQRFGFPKAHLFQLTTPHEVHAFPYIPTSIAVHFSSHLVDLFLLLLPLLLFTNVLGKAQPVMMLWDLSAPISGHENR